MGCGSSATAPRAPAPVENRAVAAPNPGASALPLLPGSVGLATEQVPARGGCVERRTRIRQVRDGDAPAFVTFMTHEPVVLGANDDRMAQQRELETWLRSWSEELRTVNDQLEVIVRDRGAPPRARVEAAARLAQTLAHAGDTLLAIGAPEALATDAEMLATYCDALEQQALSFSARSGEARAACRRLAEELQTGAGWWTDVCADP